MRRHGDRLPVSNEITLLNGVNRCTDHGDSGRIFTSAFTAMGRSMSTIATASCRRGWRRPLRRSFPIYEAYPNPTRAPTPHLARRAADRGAGAERRGQAGHRCASVIAAGQRVAREYSMSVVLAEEVPKVPAVTGLALADATTRLEARGYAAQVGATVAHATVAVGLIFEQSPKAEAPHPKGGTVTLQVSSGPGDLEVPKLLGVGHGQAKTDLEKLGLKAAVRWVAMAETPTYIVLSQKPAAGEKVKPGGEVQLTACR